MRIIIVTIYYCFRGYY